MRYLVGLLFACQFLFLASVMAKPDRGNVKKSIESAKAQRADFIGEWVGPVFLDIVEEDKQVYFNGGFSWSGSAYYDDGVMLVLYDDRCTGRYTIKDGKLEGYHQRPDCETKFYTKWMRRAKE